MSKYFGFVEKDERRAVEDLIWISPTAFHHLHSQCGTIFITLIEPNYKGQTFFVMKCDDESYGILKVVDENLHGEILSEGGNICGHLYLEMVSDFLIEEMENKKSATFEEKAEYAMMAITVLGLQLESMHLMHKSFKRLLKSQPEIDTTGDIDYSQN